MRYENVLIHEGVAHDNNPPGPGSGRYPWGSGERAYQHVDRVEIDDTIKLDDLKTTTTARVNGFVDQAGSQPINSQKVKDNSDMGKNQVRVNNPSGNGTIPLYKKYRQYPNQGYAWNSSYPSYNSPELIKAPNVSPKTKLPAIGDKNYDTVVKNNKLVDAKNFQTQTDLIGKTSVSAYKGVDAIVKELKKYKQGQLDDKARKRLDKKIRKMSNEELEVVSKRFTAEYNTINAINNRNKVTVPQGQSYTTTLSNMMGSSLTTAMNVATLIATIKKIRGG